MDQLPLNLDGKHNAGNKTLKLTGASRFDPRLCVLACVLVAACRSCHARVWIWRRGMMRSTFAFAFAGLKRLKHFAEWASLQPEGQAIIIAGHSLWFKSFFQLFLPRSSTHLCVKRKIVNCGAVALTLQRGRSADGAEPRFRIKPDSLQVVYGGFASK